MTRRPIAVAVLALVACGPPPPCKPTNESSSCGGLTEQCDVGTKMCVEAPKCTTDFDCKNGFACGLTGCNLNCGDTSGNPTDSYCAGGFKCSSSFTCVAIGACTPNGSQSQCNNGECDVTNSQCTSSTACTTEATCGNYSCVSGSVTAGSICKKSCGSDTDCASGKTCSAGACG
jgi:hypothetical protein